jgi:hypothetical protein
MPPLEQPKKHFPLSLIVIVFILLFGVILFMYSGGRLKQEEVPTTQYTEENVVVDHTSLSGADKLPSGFPQEIPVDKDAEFTQSYKASYPDHRVVQYTVEYKSSSSVEEQITIYSDFFKKNGYESTLTSENETVKAYYATKNNDDISLVVSNLDGKAVVLITYLDRQ